MSSLLLFGFLLGMKHALEADHLAAVAALTTDNSGIRSALRQGLAWGIGHTLTLFAFGFLVLAFDLMVPDRLAGALEFAVGVMLIVLGLDIFRRLGKRPVHIHVHAHSGGLRHLHVHSQTRSSEEQRDLTHRHVHPGRFPVRALLVGLVHGMAGSAALIVLTLQTVNSPRLGLLYIVLFGVGSILGMGVLSTIVAVPLSKTRRLTRTHSVFQLMIASVTVFIGLSLMLDQYPGLLG